MPRELPRLFPEQTAKSSNELSLQFSLFIPKIPSLPTASLKTPNPASFNTYCSKMLFVKQDYFHFLVRPAAVSGVQLGTSWHRALYNASRATLLTPLAPLAYAVICE